ncbi:hypothetical protein HPB52_006268 [Rhipicephalus sanguineus]|uniref:Uncharacterized protein n=1 Tax=Rhipicephalus sanguineus TaxID=34632 RepID=A0A9D4QGW8_RHISA|nr:hypothetical protein HPB52_006268 [Rhipicephalus sanguineus]
MVSAGRRGIGARRRGRDGEALVCFDGGEGLVTARNRPIVLQETLPVLQRTPWWWAARRRAAIKQREAALELGLSRPRSAHGVVKTSEGSPGPPQESIGTTLDVSESRGPRGSVEALLTEDWSPEENALNVTLPLQGGTDYQISVRAAGRDSQGKIVWGPELEVEVSVTLVSRFQANC